MRQIPTTQLDSSEVDFILLLRGMILLLSTWTVGNWRYAPAQGARVVFCNFSEKNSCIVRTRRYRVGLTVYPPKVLQEPTLPPILHGGIIKNQNSDFVKAFS
jgi:hypothetical protein